MTFELITPPAAEPFSLSDIRAALRIDHTSDDDVLMRLAVTARRLIERRLGLAIAEQTWRYTERKAPCGQWTLRPGPVTAITAAEAHYGESVLPLDAWVLIPGRPAILDIEAPSSHAGESFTALHVTFTSGHADVSTTPADLIQAIMMLTAHYYEHREAVTDGRYVVMPEGVEAILKAHREALL